MGHVRFMRREGGERGDGLGTGLAGRGGDEIKFRSPLISNCLAGRLESHLEGEET